MSQDFLGSPSTSTVQAPQISMPQPYFVPVSPSTSRSVHSSGRRRVDVDAVALAVHVQRVHGCRSPLKRGEPRVPSWPQPRPVQCIRDSRMGPEAGDSPEFMTMSSYDIGNKLVHFSGSFQLSGVCAGRPGTAMPGAAPALRHDGGQRLSPPNPCSISVFPTPGPPMAFSYFPRWTLRRDGVIAPDERLPAGADRSRSASSTSSRCSARRCWRRS